MILGGSRKGDRSSSEYKDGTIVIDCQLFARLGEIMRKSDSLMGGSGKFYSDTTKILLPQFRSVPYWVI